MAPLCQYLVTTPTTIPTELPSPPCKNHDIVAMTVYNAIRMCRAVSLYRIVSYVTLLLSDSVSEAECAADCLGFTTDSNACHHSAHYITSQRYYFVVCPARNVALKQQIALPASLKI